MTARPLKVCLIQMTSGSDVAANIEQARRLMADAQAKERPDLFCLPENMSMLGGSPSARLEAGAAYPGHPAYGFAADFARAHGAWVHAGTIPEHNPGETRNRNTSVLFARDGSEAARYSKIHMFDVVTPDGQKFLETDVNAPGDALASADIEGVRFGLSVCYDLRFAELYLALAADGAEALFVPAAFTMQTGRDHWEVLLRARAIETQCWVLAAAQTGRFTLGDGSEAQMYGRSMVIDPWGTVVAQAPDGPGWVSAWLDPVLTASVRARMPVAAHRRL